VSSEILDDEQQLHRLWAAYRAQVSWWEAVERGDDPATAGQSLAGLPEVPILEALEVNRRLVAVLLHHRRDAVVAARAEGSSWLEIGTALGTSKQRAHARYRPQKPPGGGQRPTPRHRPDRDDSPAMLDLDRPVAKSSSAQFPTTLRSPPSSTAALSAPTGHPPGVAPVPGHVDSGPDPRRPVTPTASSTGIAWQ